MAPATAPARFRDVSVEEDHILRFITNPIKVSATREAKVKALARLSKENEPALRAVARAIDRRLGTRTQVDRKHPDRISDKAVRPDIRRKKPWHDVEHVRDALRLRTSLHRLDSVCDAVAVLLEKKLGIVKTDLDKMLRPGLWGWRFAGFDLRMPDRQLVEYYLAVEEVMAENDRTCHALFESWRNRPHAERVVRWREYQRDIETSRDAYDAAWRQALRRLRLTLESAAAEWQQVRGEFGR
jgi:hypothetical protein